MSVRLANNVILLEGSCSMDDAEVLLRVLLDAPQAEINWQNCDVAHTAVIQLLLVSGRAVGGTPHNDFLKDKIAPILRDINAR